MSKTVLITGASGYIGGRLLRELEPLGVRGLLYWYSLYPFHKLIFTKMLKEIAHSAYHPL